MKRSVVSVIFSFLALAVFADAVEGKCSRSTKAVDWPSPEVAVEAKQVTFTDATGQPRTFEDIVEMYNTLNAGRQIYHELLLFFKDASETRYVAGLEGNKHLWAQTPPKFVVYKVDIVGFIRSDAYKDISDPNSTRASRGAPLEELRKTYPAYDLALTKSNYQYATKNLVEAPEFSVAMATAVDRRNREREMDWGRYISACNYTDGPLWTYPAEIVPND